MNESSCADGNAEKALYIIDKGVQPVSYVNGISGINRYYDSLVFVTKDIWLLGALLHDLPFESAPNTDCININSLFQDGNH